MTKRSEAYQAAYERFVDEYLDGQGDPEEIFEAIYDLGRLEAQTTTKTDSSTTTVKLNLEQPPL